MLLFIKEILPTMFVDFLLMLLCIGGAVGCCWIIFHAIDDMLETYRWRKRQQELERMVNNDNT